MAVFDSSWRFNLNVPKWQCKLCFCIDIFCILSFIEQRSSSVKIVTNEVEQGAWQLFYQWSTSWILSSYYYDGLATHLIFGDGWTSLGIVNYFFHNQANKRWNLARERFVKSNWMKYCCQGKSRETLGCKLLSSLQNCQFYDFWQTLCTHRGKHVVCYLPHLKSKSCWRHKH